MWMSSFFPTQALWGDKEEASRGSGASSRTLPFLGLGPEETRNHLLHMKLASRPCSTKVLREGGSCVHVQLCSPSITGPGFNSVGEATVSS